MSSFEVGQTVIVSRFNQPDTLGTISEITKSGKIRVGGILYYKNGVEYGKKNDVWGRTTISGASVEGIKEVQLRNIRNRAELRMRYHDIEKLSYEDCQIIISILERAHKEGK